MWRRPAEPLDVERELRALWAEIGREQPVTRAIMSNLVVLKETRAKEHVDLATPIPDVPLEEVARRHPARILVLYHVRGSPVNCPPLAAAVSVMTFGSEASQVGVETIAIESSCAESSLPSIVRRLTFGDLPTTLWWVDDLSNAAPTAGLASMARQIVYDSRQWRDLRAGFGAVSGLLSGDAPPDVADLNWRRLIPLQAALSAIVRTRRDALDPEFRGTIRHRPGEGALAHLLAGWIAARMRWRADQWAVAIEEWRHGDDVLQVTLADRTGKTVTAEQNRQRVLARDSRVKSPVVLPVPHQAPAEAMALELAAISQDVCFRDAVLALAQRG